MRNILKLFADIRQRNEWMHEQAEKPSVVIRYASSTVVTEDSIIYCRIIRREHDADMLQGMEFHECDTSARGCLVGCNERAYALIRTRIRS